MLERYIPTDGPQAAIRAPRFGVTSNTLYYSGYPPADPADGTGGIVRDDDAAPNFQTVNNALELR